MPNLNEIKWDYLTHGQREEHTKREWDLEALTIFGNMNVLAEAIGANNFNPTFAWACAELNQHFEDQIGWGYTLASENPEISALVYDVCEFANGKELTGHLEDWIMNTDNQYTR